MVNKFDISLCQVRVNIMKGHRVFVPNQ